MESSPQYEACRTLRQEGMGCYVWFEDATRFYGVNTVLFKLYIIVADIDLAVEVLLRRGWKPNRPLSNDYYSFLWGSDDTTLPHHRLMPPDSNADVARTTNADVARTTNQQSVVVLLPAAFWTVPGDLPLQGSLMPPLPILANSMIAVLLDCPEGSLQRHVAFHVATLYGYVDQMKQPGFANKLDLAHRQFHLDAVNGETVTTKPAVRRQREKRDAILQAERESKVTDGVKSQHETQKST